MVIALIIIIVLAVAVSAVLATWLILERKNRVPKDVIAANPIAMAIIPTMHKNSKDDDDEKSTRVNTYVAVRECSAQTTMTLALDEETIEDHKNSDHRATERSDSGDSDHSDDSSDDSFVDTAIDDDHDHDHDKYRQIAALYSPSGEPTKENFGSSLLMTPKFYVVGASSAYDGCGVVYVYRRDNSQLHATLFPPSLKHVIGFGTTLSFDGDNIIHVGDKNGSTYNLTI